MQDTGAPTRSPIVYCYDGDSQKHRVRSAANAIMGPHLQGDSNAERPATQQQRNQKAEATQEGIGSNLVSRPTETPANAGVREEDIELAWVRCIDGTGVADVQPSCKGDVQDLLMIWYSR